MSMEKKIIKKIVNDFKKNRALKCNDNMTGGDKEIERGLNLNPISNK